jgi:hypothetical protein
MLLQSDEARAEVLMKAAQADAERRYSIYSQLAAMKVGKAAGDDGQPTESGS